MASGIYIHIPFCKSRCSYCDFATEIYRDVGTVARYLRALEREICEFERFDLSADTIYFGGGTPSLLSVAELANILRSLSERFEIADDCEITLEMNPATVSLATLREYRNLGVTRASFGIQTFDNRELRLLARGHSSEDALNTFRMLRDAGFDNVNFDLIAGLPGQTIFQWRENLCRAAELRPEHISLYLLEVHPGTPLATQIETGRRPSPDDDVAAEMYNIMCDFLAEQGYIHYEISNFALSGFESRHNLKYWKMLPVYGFGVSAYSFDGTRRYSNPREIDKYITAIESGLPMREIDEASLPAHEAIYLGLRLTEGIDSDSIERQYGIQIFSQFGNQLDELVEAGLLNVHGSRIRLTRKGMLYSNEVFRLFV